MKCYKCKIEMLIIDREIAKNTNTKLYKCPSCGFKSKLYYEKGKVKKAEIEGASLWTKNSCEI